MILVLGGEGYVARSLGRAFQRANWSSGEEYRIISRRETDYTDRTKLRKVLSEGDLRGVINAAGYTGKPNVDACEDHREDCWEANVEFPAMVAESCEEAGIPFGQVSTGCIYDGEAPRAEGYREEDPPNFYGEKASWYSTAKFEGEKRLNAMSGKIYLWRIRMPFNGDLDPRNYLQKILSYDTLVDVRNSLTQIDEAAEAMIKCMEDEVAYGTYHLVNSGSISTKEIVEMIRQRSEKRFKFFESYSEFLKHVRVPRSNCVLDNSKALKSGCLLSPVKTAVENSLDELLRSSSGIERR